VAACFQKIARVSLGLGIVVLSAGSVGREGAFPEQYYMVVFGAQEEGGCPEASHCFVTFARIAPGFGLGWPRSSSSITSTS
jgi:hypothetical protein